MKCPSETFSNAWGGDNATSYRFNTGTTYGYGLGVSDAYTVNPAYKLVWGRIKDQQLERPSYTFVIGDGITGPGDYEYIIENLATFANVSTYHNGGANFLFTDGHAGNMLKNAVTLEIFDRRRL